MRNFQNLLGGRGILYCWLSFYHLCRFFCVLYYIERINRRCFNRGFRYGRWKYVEGSASCSQPSCNKPQLYDLETDLGERHDLSLEYPEKLIELQHKFKVWHDSVMVSRRVESKCKKVNNLPLPMSFMVQNQQQQHSTTQADVRED